MATNQESSAQEAFNTPNKLLQSTDSFEVIGDEDGEQIELLERKPVSTEVVAEEKESTHSDASSLQQQQTQQPARPMKQEHAGQDNEIYEFFCKVCCCVIKKNENLCQCVKPITNHADAADHPSDSQRSPTTNAREVEQNMFFQLNEVTGSQAKHAKYTRVSDANAAYLHHLESWAKDVVPEICLSFIGGCQKGCINDELENTIRAGVNNILDVYKCVLITRGTHVELSKLIGSLVSGKFETWKESYTSSSCIGVIPWQYIKGRQSLTATEAEGQPRTFSYYDPTIPKDGRKPSQDDGQFPLDANHREFFFVDDGTTEATFFSTLTQAFYEAKIPTTVILAGGGRTTLQMVHRMLSAGLATHPVPVIIMKGSGRLADLLLELIRCWDSMVSEPEKCKIIETLLEQYKIWDSSTQGKYVSLLFDCLEEKRKFLFECKASEDLKEKIIQATLCSSGVGEALALFTRISVALESCDPKLARNLMGQIKTHDITKELLNSCLLKQNIKHMKYLLEHCEVNLQKFVENWLHDLYNVDENQRMDAVICYFKVQKDDELDASTINSALNSLCNNDTANDVHIARRFNNAKDKITYNKEVINSVQALLINRTMRLRYETINFLWFYDKYNPLSNALLIYAILTGIRKIYRKTGVFRYVPDEFEDTVKFYHEQISKLLDIYYKVDRDMAEKVLTTRIPLWNNRTLFEIVGDLELKEVLCEPACQRVMSESWRRKETLRKNQPDELPNTEGNGHCCENFIKLLGAPNVKFWQHTIVYFIHLLVFSFYVLSWKTAVHVPIKYTVFVYVAALALDEVRQVVTIHKGGWNNLKHWISSVWNILDVISFFLFSVGFILSWFHSSISKFFFSLYLFLSWLKFTQFLRTFPVIGPYMVMILKMLLRMKSFLLVVTVSIFAYGVFMTAMIFPDAPFSWETLFNVLFRPYLLLFGDAGIENFQWSKGTTVFGTPKITDYYEVLVLIGMAAFLLFANQLLINILIADFSYIYQKVEGESNEVWQYEKFVLLVEFLDKPVLPVPLSIFENIWILLKEAFCKKPRDEDRRSDIDAEKRRRELADFEYYCFKKMYPTIPAPRD